MKKTLYIIIAALCIFASCDEKNGTIPEDPTEQPKEMSMAEKIIGSWHCPATSVDAEIYVTFTKSNTFSLYQKVGDGRFRSYNGTWKLTTSDNKYLLSGEYNDGEPWGATYEATSTGDDVITLTADNVSETYSRVEAIPEEVISNSVTVVKSHGEESSRGYF